jgi:hypothetical protein
LKERERETNEESNDQDYSPEYGDEVNDIKELERELKENLMNSNSNFRNPTLEEPSPPNSETYGTYHWNLIKHEVVSQPPLLDRIERLSTSNSHPMLKFAASTSSTTGMTPNMGYRGSTHYPTPTNYNYALNDQISMFSSQDKRAVNTSDIVEYSKEIPFQRPPVSYADTFERDPGFNRAQTTRKNQAVHNFESFQPVEHIKNDFNENNENPDQEDGFSFDKKNLFNIEDLHSRENKPLRELKVESKSQRDNSGSRKRKVKPLDLPMTTFKAQKHQKLMRESQKFNVNKISTDSPLRITKKTHSRAGSKSIRDKSEPKENKYNTSIFKRGLFMQSNQWINPDRHFFKFIHTSLPFCNIQLDYNNSIPLTELDIAWRNDEGKRDPIIADLFSDEEVDHQFIPLPVQRSRGLNKDLNAEFKSHIEPQLNNFIPKSRSLVRPTPVKNRKIIKDESEDDVISEMRSLTVRPTHRENQNQSLTQTHNTARIKSRTLEMENEIIIDPVTMKTKRKLLKWLEDINLIRRKAVTIKDFAQFWRNGVIFFDLVNKLCGRNPLLKGIQRNPKNITSINANFLKVLTHLRTFPKMNARYLWAENLMMEGNNEVIWGFIDDIWFWNNNKISPNDTTKNTKCSKSKLFSKSPNSSIISNGNNLNFIRFRWKLNYKNI